MCGYKSRRLKGYEGKVSHKKVKEEVLSDPNVQNRTSKYCVCVFTLGLIMSVYSRINEQDDSFCPLLISFVFL